MIQRENQILAVLRYLDRHRIAGVVGARQVGKSTLARQIADRFDGPSRIYRLETVRDRQRMNVPERELANAPGLVILDEAQRHPRLFPSLPKILAANRHGVKLLLLGGSSANYRQPGLESIGEHLVIHELPALSLHEVGSDQFKRLWLRGGLPASFTAASRPESFKLRTGVTLDITDNDAGRPGPPVAGGTLRSFLLSLAQYHGKPFDVVELARSFGVRNSTVERYLDILRESYVIRMISAHRAGGQAGEVILPKVFFSDTGILHNLLGFESMEDLEASPKADLSWKGFAMESTIRRIRAGATECSHWTVKTGQGIDLLVQRGGLRITPSMKMSMHVLKLDRVDIVHRSEGPGKLDGKVQVHTLESLPRSMRLPDGFERRPEFLEIEKELAEAEV